MNTINRITLPILSKSFRFHTPLTARKAERLFWNEFIIKRINVRFIVENH